MYDVPDLVCQALDARSCEVVEVLQSLWSGYGQILRVKLVGGPATTAILKHIAPPQQSAHPRGWNTRRSHARKLRSYEVESCWYTRWSGRCSEASRVPRCFAALQHEHHRWIALEDLDQAGFPGRRAQLRPEAARQCLRWLAHFHAQFLGERPEGLWPIGTYWHLDTRPDEWEAMEDKALQKAAQLLDQKLNQARFQTFVHGDAKVANFCFSEDSQDVAAVDFQYVGGGCGMKDVAYFLGSSFDAWELERWVPPLLDDYFRLLQEALHAAQKDVDFEALEAEWRKIFPLAWADFSRFLNGWMPQHRKVNAYSQHLTSAALLQLKNSK